MKDKLIIKNLNDGNLHELLAMALAMLSGMEKEKSRDVMREAVAESYVDAGCGNRSHLALACVWIGKAACEMAEEDHDELASFYTREAEDAGNSDHSPEDCRQWAAEYHEAARAYSFAASELSEAGGTLESTLDEIDL